MYVDSDIQDYYVSAKEMLTSLNDAGFEGSVEFITEMKHTGKIID
jgi:hypothetical protein